MIIVPTGDLLAVEAFIENTDIGFVRTGQAAEVKIDAFPFTKYGTIDSQVLLVLHDAIEDEKRGLIFAFAAALASLGTAVGKAGLALPIPHLRAIAITLEVTALAAESWDSIVGYINGWMNDTTSIIDAVSGADPLQPLPQRQCRTLRHGGFEDPCL